MKRGIRVLGLDDSPALKNREKRLVVGVVWRNGIVEGVMSTSVSADGDDSTRKLGRLVNRSRFKQELRALLLQSITLAGFNIVDINRLAQETGLPVIAIVRKKPDEKKVGEALAHTPDFEKKRFLIEKAGKPVRICGWFAQFAGCDKKKAEEVLKITGGEPIRLAHVIASGIVRGESKGRY